MAIYERLELHYRDMLDTEFTIEQGKLWMLQTRVGKRTGAAALRIAVSLTKDPKIKLTPAEAVQRVAPEHLDQVLHPQFEKTDAPVLGTGLAASPGAGVGTAYFDADRAADAADRGEKVILVRQETSPEDVHGMAVAEAILTSRGGLVSHAAVVARGWGKPAVVGAESLTIGADSFTDRRRHGRQRGRGHLGRRHDRQGLPRRGRRGRGPAARRVRHHPRLGRRDPRRQARACGPTPTPARTPPGPASSAPRASACAAPSTCSSAIACRSCAA